MKKKSIIKDKKKIVDSSKKTVVKKKTVKGKEVLVSKKVKQVKAPSIKTKEEVKGSSKKMKLSIELMQKAIAENPLNSYKTNLGYYRGSRVKCFAFIDNVLACMKDNPNYETPSPALSDIEDEKELYNKSHSDGDTTASDKHYKNFIYLTKQLGVYVANNCGNDLGVFLSSGFKANKPNTRLKQKMGKVKIKKVKDTKKSGEARVTVEAIIGVAFHECQYQEVIIDPDTLKETFGKMIQVSGKPGVKQLFKGLPVGKRVLLYVRAIGPMT